MYNHEELINKVLDLEKEVLKFKALVAELQKMNEQVKTGKTGKEDKNV